MKVFNGRADMTHIEIKSRVGPDGVLKVAVPVGMAQANREVKITVESLEQTAAKPRLSPEQWKQFIEETAGCWKGDPLARPAQGELENREQWP
jgi:hypothetical protein